MWTPPWFPTWRCLCALHTKLWFSPPTCQPSSDTASKPRNTQKCWNRNNYNRQLQQNDNWLQSITRKHANLLFLVKAHPEPESPVCESLGHSPHTGNRDGRREINPPIQNQQYNTERWNQDHKRYHCSACCTTILNVVRVLKNQYFDHHKISCKFNHYRNDAENIYRKKLINAKYSYLCLDSVRC